MTAKPVWSKTITIQINTAGKLLAKDNFCVGGIGGEVISLY